MEILKRKILLEDSIDRNTNSPTWGIITATTFYINVFLSQNIDDMGLFSDIDYISLDGSTPNYSVLDQKLSSNGILFPFMSGATSNITNLTQTDNISLRLPQNTVESYFNYGNANITGSTDSKIGDVMSYDPNNPYIAGFNINTNTYTNYQNVTINGVNRATSLGEPTIYVFDTPVDQNIGTPNQIYGLQYQDYTGQTRTVVINGVTSNIPVTNFLFKGEGINETNTSLSALTKEEYLFGITETPDVQSDVYIDRGVTSIMDMQLRLSEVSTIDELTNYGNGFYNITKQ